MSSKENCSLQVLFLDADRNPIEKISYKLRFNGAIISGETGMDGLTKKLTTASSGDSVQIAIERTDKSMKTVARVIAEAGSKLVTLVSPRVKVVGPTLPHLAPVPGQIPEKKEIAPPIYDPQKTKPPSEKKEFGPKIEKTKNSQGNPVAKVEGDIPNLEFLDEYNGEEMSEADYEWAAKTLDIEHAAIKAFAVVEAEGEAFLKIGSKTVPKILYERHWFAKFTNNVYSKLNPDISLPCGYYNKKDRYILADALYKRKRNVPEEVAYYRPLNKKDNDEIRSQAVPFKDLVKEGKLAREDHAYYDEIGSYKRLIKAYALAPAAALQSCSWGVFQIMGVYWKVMGYASVVEFTKSMSRSPKEQIKAFVLYVEKVNPQLKKLLRAKDWDAVACAYNGPDYAVNQYHLKLEREYKKAKKEP
ncbi:N-acetylmuramidase domain-containing protein [Massilia sp. BHUDP2]|uniref:N-acetylmuramidase domain-containing protein n=1 Tax=Massilia sp. BHUDP2 TaxID=3034505 RepID=UPI003906D359